MAVSLMKQCGEYSLYHCGDITCASISRNDILEFYRVCRIKNRSFQSFFTGMMDLEIAGVVDHFEERLA